MKNIIIRVPDNCELIKENDTTFKMVIGRKPETWKNFTINIIVV